MLAFGFEREVDHHDSVLFDDSDKQDDAYDRDHAQILAEQHESEQSSHAGRRQSGKNRDGMNETFIQDAQHDVNGHQRGQNEQCFVRQRILERSRRALKIRLQAGRHVHVFLHLVDG